MRLTIVASALVLIGVGAAAHASQRVVAIDRGDRPDPLVRARAACAQPGSSACQQAKELVAYQIANDLMLVASTRDRQHRELARQAADVPFPRVRAAAATALG